jgi:hypothetical protein
MHRPCGVVPLRLLNGGGFQVHHPGHFSATNGGCGVRCDGLVRDGRRHWRRVLQGPLAHAPRCGRLPTCDAPPWAHRVACTRRLVRHPARVMFSVCCVPPPPRGFPPPAALLLLLRTRPCVCRCPVCGRQDGPGPAVPPDRQQHHGLLPGPALRVGLNRAEPSRVEPSRAEPSRAEPSRAEPSRAEPSRAELSSLPPPSQACTPPSLCSQAVACECAVHTTHPFERKNGRGRLSKTLSLTSQLG